MPAIRLPQAVPIYIPITRNEIRRNVMNFLPWIPVIIAVLEAVKENMDD